MSALHSAAFAYVCVGLMLLAPGARADTVDAAIATAEGAVHDAQDLAAETLRWLTEDQCVNPYSSPLAPCEPQHAEDILGPLANACASEHGSTEHCVQAIRKLIPLR